ncbi:MAG: hypothetical protein HPY58_04090 [Firmicutes bacterium]|nr:hypothetical protein [Bacillota bacterium]
MSQEQGPAPEAQEASLFSLLARVLISLEEKRMDISGIVALLSLFNLFSILNLVQNSQGVAMARTGGGSLLSGGLIETLAGLFAEGGKAGPELLLNLLQKQGKKINPQLLGSLLSLAGGGKGGGGEGGEGGKPKAEYPQEKRQGRGIF